MSDPVKSIGSVPWTNEQVLSELDAFAQLYEQRPIQDNAGGMRAPHMFATWLMARHLNPKTIIESGVWRGQSTWLLQQACPDAALHSIDLNLSKREYISPSATYYEIDFSEIDWTEVDPTNALVFFDDHQNAYTRLQQCYWFGFRDIIFEDNYPPGRGDFYTLKQAFAGAGFGAEDQSLPSERYKSLSAKVLRKAIAVGGDYGLFKGLSAIPQYNRTAILPNTADAHYLEQRLSVYQEFPPAFASPSMCFDGEKGEADQHPTNHPLLDASRESDYPALAAEADDYNWICFARLKD